MKPGYVVITDANREALSTRDALAIKGGYAYRTGSLGFLHPGIMEFFADYGGNMRGYPQHLSTYGNSMCLGFWPEPGDLPVLMYKGEWRPRKWLTRTHDDERRYVIGLFSGDELEELDGPGFNPLHDSMIKICRERDIPFPNDPASRQALHDQWEALGRFDERHEGGIHEVPLEVAPRRISAAALKSKQQYLAYLNSDPGSGEQNPRDPAVYPPGEP